MRLRDRIERIEEVMDRPRRYGDGEGGVTLIHIRGGLPDHLDDGLHATVGDVLLVCEPGEPWDNFIDRVRSAAIEAGEPFAVVGGLMPMPR